VKQHYTTFNKAQGFIRASIDHVIDMGRATKKM